MASVTWQWQQSTINPRILSYEYEYSCCFFLFSGGRVKIKLKFPHLHEYSKFLCWGFLNRKTYRSRIREPSPMYSLPVCPVSYQIKQKSTSEVPLLGFPKPYNTLVRGQKTIPYALPPYVPRISQKQKQIEGAGHMCERLHYRITISTRNVRRFESRTTNARIK